MLTDSMQFRENLKKQRAWRGAGRVAAVVLHRAGRAKWCILGLLLLWFLSMPIAILSISFYQQYVSPHKGWRCAYAALHGGASCSEYAKEEISRHGVLWGTLLLRNRFGDCREAAVVLAANPASGQAGKECADGCVRGCCNGPPRATPQRPTMTAGWASATGFRWAETAVQQKVVQNANAEDGKSSGSSSLAPAGLEGWETDVGEGDGELMREAIRDYDEWYSHQSVDRQAPGATEQIFEQMRARFSNSRYLPQHQAILVQRIADQYNIVASSGRVAVPTNDQETLFFLGIRRQCLEWTASIAIRSGGAARNYHSAKSVVSNPSDFRPGMLLFMTNKNNSHAMVIVDIFWTAQGKPTWFRVAEANYELGRWSNPNGQVPWCRTVRSGTHARKVAVGIAVYVVRCEGP